MSPSKVRVATVLQKSALVDAMLAGIAVLLLMLGAAAALPSAAAAHRVQRGIIDDTWVLAAPDQCTAIVKDLSSGLHCQVVRLAISWAQAEPQPGQYDEAYLGAVRESLAAARAKGLQLMVLVYQTPKWASDRSFWDDPPGWGFGLRRLNGTRKPSWYAFADLRRR